jgi:septal ring-binding cell division protein DamX
VSVETPPPPEQPTGRQCPRCGTPMTDEQEWCLACGAAVGTRIVAAPGWRAPIAIAGAILAVAAIAVAIAIVQLADDTGEVAQNPPAASPTPAAQTPAPTATPDPATGTEPELPEASGGSTPEPTTTPSASPSPESTSTPESGGGTSDIAEWPAGTSGWTVVLASDTSESDAQDAAERFAADGIDDVGVLQSDDFSSLKPGFWVVYSGEYDSQAEASDALDGIDAKDAYIRRIVPN